MRKVPHVTIVAISSQQQCDVLRSTLANLGYATTLSGNVGRGNDAGAADGSLMIHIGHKEFSREKLSSFLKDSREACLGVVERNSVEVEIDLLDFCDEVVQWPCGPDKLNAALATFRDRKGPSRRELANLNLIGRSPAFVEAVNQMAKLARYDVSVLIQGETGTGKELAARAIHALSARRNGPFIPVNCGAIPDELVENELFGHAKGAFTDARDAQAGVVALAENGTLFLDEIESLSAKAQVTLLRFLQDRQYRVLGGRNWNDADVRVIAAGHDDLAALVREGRFREDLYFRLNVAKLWLPPLRERAGDAALLAEHFCERYRKQYGGQKKTLHESLLKWLSSQPWPGNVRELENTIHRAFVFSESDVVVLEEQTSTAAPISVSVQSAEQGWADIPLRDAKARIISEFEKRYLNQLLAEVKGNVTQAALRARTERRALGKLLKKHRIAPETYRDNKVGGF